MDNSDVASNVELAQVYGEQPAQDLLRALVEEYAGYQFSIEQVQGFPMWRRIYTVVSKAKMINDLFFNHTAVYNEVAGFAKGWLARSENR